jgi:hypothetical protein
MIRIFSRILFGSIYVPPIYSLRSVVRFRNLISTDPGRPSDLPQAPVAASASSHIFNFVVNSLWHCQCPFNNFPAYFSARYRDSRAVPQPRARDRASLAVTPGPEPGPSHWARHVTQAESRPRLTVLRSALPGRRAAGHVAAAVARARPRRALSPGCHSLGVTVPCVARVSLQALEYEFGTY